MLHRRLMAANEHLDKDLKSQHFDLVESRNAVVWALAELLTYRGLSTSAHLRRMTAYAECLATELAKASAFRAQIDEEFVRNISIVAPLHDIGMIGVPEHILLKPARLDADERFVVQTHTTIGAEILLKIARRNGVAAAFLQMGIDVARHHHERWDGLGYPDRLKGVDIPLAARIVAVVDVYDALRSRRAHKPALAHAAATQLILEASPGQFDPQIVTVFQNQANQFERIFKECCDN